MTNTVKVKAQAHRRAFEDARIKYGLRALTLGRQCGLGIYTILAIVNRNYVYTQKLMYGG